MKKRFILFLAALLVMTAVAGCGAPQETTPTTEVPINAPTTEATEPSTEAPTLPDPTTEPQPQMSRKEQLHARAAQLSERFGMEICIPEQLVTYTHYEAYPLDDLHFLQSTLDTMEETLSQFPEGFFRQLPYGDVETIRLELVGAIKVRDSAAVLYPEDVDAFAQAVDNRHIVVINSYFMIDTLLYHEFTHIIDAHLAWDAGNRPDALFSEETWLSLQPEGFRFAMHYNQVPEELLSYLETDYFKFEYSLTFPTEDRATMIDAIIENGGVGYEPGTGRRAKLQYYADCIRDCFDTTGWPEVTPWEKPLH